MRRTITTIHIYSCWCVEVCEPIRIYLYKCETIFVEIMFLFLFFSSLFSFLFILLRPYYYMILLSAVAARSFNSFVARFECVFLFLFDSILFSPGDSDALKFCIFRVFPRSALLAFSHMHNM